MLPHTGPGALGTNQTTEFPLLTVALASSPSGLSELRLPLVLLLVPVNAALLSCALLLNSRFLKTRYSHLYFKCNF